MKVRITHPVQTDTDLLQAGRTAEIVGDLAEEWIRKGWAFEIHEQEETVTKPRRKPRKDGEL